MFGKRTIANRFPSVAERAPYGMEAVAARAEENAQHRRDVAMRGMASPNVANRLVLEARRTSRALAAAK